MLSKLVFKIFYEIYFLFITFEWIFKLYSGGTSVANSAYQSMIIEQSSFSNIKGELIHTCVSKSDDRTILNVCLTSSVKSIGDSAFASSSLSSIFIST